MDGISGYLHESQKQVTLFINKYKVGKKRIKLEYET